MLATAAAAPGTLVIGIDANAASMSEVSRRAARRRRGLPNAVFVVAAAEGLPAELVALADDVTIHFPWGSLLRGVLGAEPDVLAEVARVCRPGASVTAILSVTARDGLELRDPLDDPAAADRLAASAIRVGLELVELRAATVAEIAAARSSWAKRIGAGRRRSATLLRFRRKDLR